ncbi:MAG: ATP-binding protein [Chitinispirillaceae bacterium]|nr:ATP-binding protein [Chitinispirillaceae bacterium]
MDISFPYHIKLCFPGNLEYIPAVRKYISELLQISSFSPKFAYRSEIIVDELCNNAVNFGCRAEDARVELECTFFNDRIEFTIKDQGGLKENVDKLRSSLDSPVSGSDSGMMPHQGMGLEIVRMLSEKLDVKIDKENLTSVHVVRKRENSASE